MDDVSARAVRLLASATSESVSCGPHGENKRMPSRLGWMSCFEGGHTRAQSVGGLSAALVGCVRLALCRVARNWVCADPWMRWRRRLFALSRLSALRWIVCSLCRAEWRKCPLQGETERRRGRRELQSCDDVHTEEGSRALERLCLGPNTARLRSVQVRPGP